MRYFYPASNQNHQNEIDTFIINLMTMYIFLVIIKLSRANNKIFNNSFPFRLFNLLSL